ncbi:hypothetical protein HPULCUR_003071 [Helicostylum pulchrum]|uniref:Uncharacterized protein n=1 Tax=Helicostylum pulchrum TaxID=562976 RepID=A0ABP9XSB8_9FUNG
MIRSLTSLFASIFLGTLVPVSNYIGQHRYECDREAAITGELVQDKIYTFGGCYPMPYIAGNIFNFNDNHNNVSETIQIYDIKKDEWMQETEVKLPFPWRSASTQTHQQNIYFYNVRSAESFQSKMWKYDTVLKKFSALDELPFKWHGSLKTCANIGRMYFVGSNDGMQRNVIHVYNIENGVWEKPLFPNLRFTIKQILCGKDAIQFLGTVVTDKNDGVSVDFQRKKHVLISTDYITGDTVLKGLCVRFADNAIVKTNNDKFYFFDVKDKETVIILVDTVALVNRLVEVLPHTLTAPLFVPYQDDLFFLFGGGTNRPHFGGVQKTKTYSHKLVKDPTNNYFY